MSFVLMVFHWPEPAAQRRLLSRCVRCATSFHDPEANIWGVAVKYGSDFDDRGGFIYP